MSTKTLFALFVCGLAACQVGQNSAGFNTDPNATNPSPQPADGNNGGTGGGTQPAPSNNGGSGNDTPSNTTPTVTGQSVASPRLIGRIDPTTKLMTWPGTTIEAAFTGSGGTATFTAQSSTNSFIGVSVDNGPVTRVQIAAPASAGPTSVPFTASGSGTHTVRFYKLNEADLGTIQFNAITLNGGTLANLTPSGRRIEFVGDSITVGYGIDGVAPCTNTAALENSTKAYSWLTAKALRADASLVAVSGRGMLRNAVGVNSNTTMPTYYQQAIVGGAAPYTFPAANAPQAVVIMLGTNDYSYLSYTSGTAQASRPVLDQNLFVQTYESFVTTVRSNNPDALIVLATSPMLSDTYPPNTTEDQASSLLANVTAVAASLNDPKIVVLNIATQDTNQPTGCESHPSPTEAQKMADQLVPLLSSKLGWTN